MKNANLTTLGALDHFVAVVVAVAVVVEFASFLPAFAVATSFPETTRSNDSISKITSVLFKNNVS